MVAKIERPLRHISIRVPWHDDKWRGTVCKDPAVNTSCLRLSRISEHRGDRKHSNQCEPVSGKAINELDQKEWPCCVSERAMFMSPFEYTRMATHPYVEISAETHGHFKPTPLRHPAYSAPAIPFNWMFKSQMEQRANEYGIDLDPGREPTMPFKTDWIQELRNQTALLECFGSHVKAEKSLCFIYAKEVPFVEDSRRVLLGVGRILHVGNPVEYQYKKPGKLHAALWEIIVQHSIRPGFKDGFLLPYHELMNYLEKHDELEPSELTAFAPADHFEEFSYASELVSHDAAIEALQNCFGALNRIKTVLPGDYEGQLRWLHDRLAELWKMRGPCPGLGAVLCAFGMELGTFVAREIETKLADNEDPWPLVDKGFRNPKAVLSGESARQFGATLCDKWKTLPSERKSLMLLLSRFNLQPEQATKLYVKEERQKEEIDCSDADLLKNPYLIYETTRLSVDAVSLSTADRGLFPEEIIRKSHPLPKPSALDGGTDARRVRAFVVKELENASDNGHTLQRKQDVILAIRKLDIQPQCPVDGDLMNVVEPLFKGVIRLSELKDKSQAYQLEPLAEVGQTIRDSIARRRGGVRHKIQADWRALLNKHLPPISAEGRDQEERARTEKTAALKELAEARVSVLIGPAGTGKTTLISVLCSHPEIAKGEVLLLAPTGKARVRMEQAIKGKVRLQGFTIAQFLSGCDRYDGETGRYHLSDAPKETPAKTVIVDECSMITEEMLAALLDSLKGVERLILIGDPRQLPPIGAGRPFVDIITEVAPKNVNSIFPRVGPGYAELTVRRRQEGLLRDDTQLAEWFSGAPMEPGEDEVLEKILFGGSSKYIAFKTWETPDQFKSILFETIRDELALTSEDDCAGFDRSLGCTEGGGGYRYFNTGCGEKVERWQILSPVRKMTHGVVAINRAIHDRFRSGMVEFAQRRMKRMIPKPMGSEQIVYGDKVINVRNHTRKKVYPEDGSACYIANGEIGMVVGQFRTRNMKTAPWLMKVEFSSQPKFAYDFDNRDFKEEGEPRLELAYALTAHKAQGSEFGRVILSLPNPCRLLSRELLYTALTRQRDRVVVLHQGQRSEIRKFSSDEFSETARRLTNLFQKPSLVEHKGKFYEERLIHRTLRDELVRSKSELMIADRLHSNNIDYLYEQPLTLNGTTRYPDFTIEDSESGKKVYWEHCGMMMDPQYRERWNRKLNWYRENGVLPWNEGEGANGMLIVTRDTEKGGISSKEIDELIKRILVN